MTAKGDHLCPSPGLLGEPEVPSPQQLHVPRTRGHRSELSAQGSPQGEAFGCQTLPSGPSL